MAWACFDSELEFGRPAVFGSPAESEFAMSCAAIDSELDSTANSELAFGLPAVRWISAAGVPPGAAACGAAWEPVSWPVSSRFGII